MRSCGQTGFVGKEGTAVSTDQPLVAIPQAKPVLVLLTCVAQICVEVEQACWRRLADFLAEVVSHRMLTAYKVLSCRLDSVADRCSYNTIANCVVSSVLVFSNAH